MPDHLHMPRLPCYANVEGTQWELQQMLDRFPQPAPTDAEAAAALQHALTHSGGLGARHRTALLRFLHDFGRYCATVGAGSDALPALAQGCVGRPWVPSEEAGSEPGAPPLRIQGGSYADRRLIAAAAQMREALRTVAQELHELSPQARDAVRYALQSAGDL